MKRTLILGVLLSSITFLQACSCCCGTNSADKLMLLLAGQSSEDGADAMKFVAAEDLLIVE